MDSTKNFSTSRRRMIQTGGLLLAANTIVGFPSIVRAAQSIKIGVIHPVTGAFSYSGGQGRKGVLIAIEEINARGGIASMGGMRLEAILADAQSRPDIGATEVEKLNEAGVAAIVGPFISSIALATTQAAARHNIPHVVDVGVTDQIVTRGLTNTFRFAPGIGTIVDTAVDSLVKLNSNAGNPAKTVVIVHEESAFGTGMAEVLTKQLPNHGLEILETMKHANPTRDFSNIVTRIKSLKPDLVIPSNYYDEYVLLMRALYQQRVELKGVYSILGGAANNERFIREYPKQSANILDCGHWIDPRKPEAVAFKERVEKSGTQFTLELFLAYTAMMFLADALERAKSDDRQEIITALANSEWNDHIMPYGPTKIVNGQNTGAVPVITQILDQDVKVVFPDAASNAAPVFPVAKA